MDGPQGSQEFPQCLPKQWPLPSGSLPLERLSGDDTFSEIFTVITTRKSWKEGRRRGKGLLFKAFLGWVFQLLLFAAEPTAESCHSELGARLTLLSVPCTWCVFAAVLITLTPVFINIWNQCRRLRSAEF